MGSSRRIIGLGGTIYLLVAFCLGMYFMIGAVQGDFGLFKRVQIEVEIDELEQELETLQTELASIRNKTHRLSDDYLDLDLLDQQARDVLGLARSDEIIVN
ncbi:MAG: FtsB family cell division protein [Brevirhabdus sp.]